MTTLTSSNGHEIRVYERVFQHVERFAEGSGMLETGGILLGRFESDGGRPIICGCMGPPPDSVAGPYSFERGTQGVNAYLRSAYLDGIQYLGEWHSHPQGIPRMSGRDRVTMQGIALRSGYQMSEPILIIVAGSALKGWEYGAWRGKNWLRPAQYKAALTP